MMGSPYATVVESREFPGSWFVLINNTYYYPASEGSPPRRFGEEEARRIASRLNVEEVE